MKLQLLAVVLSALAGGGPDKSASPLPGLEAQVLEAWRKRDRAALDKLLADDYVEITAAGRSSRAQALKVLAQLNLTGYTVGDSKLVPLGDNAAILTYRLTMRGTWEGQPLAAAPLLVSAAWVRRGDKWLRIFAQATPSGDPASGEVPAPAPMAPANGFVAEATGNGVRYVYGGPAALQDVQATVTVTLADGAELTYKLYWAAWRANEIKDVSFQLANVRALQLVHLAVTATRDGKPFEGELATRR